MTAASGPALPRVRSRLARAQAAPLLLALYCLVVFFGNLGAAPLVDVDEGAFSEATREMLARGDFVTTYLNDELRFDKPILTYWLQALPVAVFGPVEWAFRLPSACAAALWAWLLYRFARDEAPDARFMAPFMLASALGPLLIARAATADALLNAFLAGALFALYRHLAHGGRAALVEAFAWTALGVLTKGPIAIAVPAFAVLTYCFSRGEWLRPLRLLTDARAWVVFLAIAVPWYLLELQAQGELFIAGFFLKHNVNRYTGTMLGHGGHVWYYVVALPLLVFPFVAPLLAALASVRRDVADDVRRYAWCTFLALFAFFSLSRTQLPHYLLYGATPLFLLLALHRNGFARPAALVVPPVLGLLAAAALPWIATAAAARTGNTLARLLLDDLAPAMRPVSIGAAVAVLVLLVLTVLVRRLPRDMRTDARLYVAGAVPALFLVVVLWPRGITWFQEPVATAGRTMRGETGPVVEWNANWPSFSVYRGAPTPVRAPRPGEIVLTRTDRAGALPRHEPIFVQREVMLARILPPSP